MQTTDNEGQNALTTDKSAILLGIHEFSLFTRIQMEEIKTERFDWGEIAIPITELERLLGSPASKFVVPQLQGPNLSDRRLLLRIAQAPEADIICKSQGGEIPVRIYPMPCPQTPGNFEYNDMMDFQNSIILETWAGCHGGKV